MSLFSRALAVLSLFVCCAALQTPKVESVLDMPEFLQNWKISKQFTLDVANARPAEF